MKYIKIAVVPRQNVKSFNSIAYQEGTEGIYFNAEKITDIEYNSFHVVKNFLLYYNKAGDFCIFKDKKLMIFEKHGFFPKSYRNNQLLLKYENKIDSKRGEFIFKIGIFDIITQKKIMDFPKISNHIFHMYLGDHYLCSYNETICCFSPATNEFVWVRHLEGAHLLKIIGKSDYVIIAILKNYRTLALNTHTGSIIWERMGGNYCSTLSPQGNSVLHLESGGLWVNGIQLVRGTNLFQEIDALTGSIKREGILADLDDLGLGIKNFSVATGFIYFTASYQGSFSATAVGVLDYETLNLLWWQEIEMQVAGGFGNFLLNQPPVVAGNQFFVLDKTQTLHIFERTKEANSSHSKIGTKGLVPFEYRTHSEDISWNQNSRSDEDLPF